MALSSGLHFKSIERADCASAPETTPEPVGSIDKPLDKCAPGSSFDAEAKAESVEAGLEGCEGEDGKESEDADSDITLELGAVHLDRDEELKCLVSFLDQTLNPKPHFQKKTCFDFRIPTHQY